MGDRAAAIRVSYSDFLTLCNVNDPEDWEPGLRVAHDGVWVKQIPDSSPTPNERACLSEHPDDDPSKPVVRFPCTLGDIAKRLWPLTGGGFIDAFVMAEFVAQKLSEAAPAASKASIGQSNRRLAEKNQFLRAALAVLWHYPPSKHTAASLARRIDEKAGLFWRSTSAPPIQLRPLTALISGALKLPKN